MARTRLGSFAKESESKIVRKASKCGKKDLPGTVGLFFFGLSEASECYACKIEEGAKKTGSTTVQNGTKSGWRFRSASENWCKKLEHRTKSRNDKHVLCGHPLLLAKELKLMWSFFVRQLYSSMLTNLGCTGQWRQNSRFSEHPTTFLVLFFKQLLGQLGSMLTSKRIIDRSRRRRKLNALSQEREMLICCQEFGKKKKSGRRGIWVDSRA